MIPNIQFFTPDRMNIFFGDIRALLYMVMPLVIVVSAGSLVGYFVVVIRNAFSNHQSQNNDHDYDDDYEDDRF